MDLGCNYSKMGEAIMLAVVCKLLLLSVALLIMTHAQLEHAKDGYPNTAKAKVKLFVSGFLVATFGGWLLFPGFSIGGLVVSAVGPGLLHGYGAVYWFPNKVKAILSKTES
jgi:hypothetical protein